MKRLIAYLLVLSTFFSLLAITPVFADDADYNIEDDDGMNREQLENEAYRKYKSSERIKKIIYIAMMIFIGIVVLKVVTGIDILKIFFDVFKTMF